MELLYIQGQVVVKEKYKRMMTGAIWAFVVVPAPIEQIETECLKLEQAVGAQTQNWERGGAVLQAVAEEVPLSWKPQVKQKLQTGS